MTKYQFTVVIEPDERGFHAYVPVLPGCHSFGETVEEAQANIHEAMELHVESMIEDGRTPCQCNRIPFLLLKFRSRRVMSENFPCHL